MITIDNATSAFWKLLQRGEEVPDLNEIANRPGWHDRAACRGWGPDLFFAGDPRSTRRAKALCAGCPVKVECAESVQLTETPGVWGGLSAADRRGIEIQGSVIGVL